MAFEHLSKYEISFLFLFEIFLNINQNSTEGGVAPAGAKVTEATIRTWLLNKFIISSV